MGMEQLMKTQAQNKAIVEALFSKGWKPDGAPDGPMLQELDPLALAQGIEHEINRGQAFGWDKVTLHMDFASAWQLAQFLRRR
jgi:hypothetical protein